MTSGGSPVSHRNAVLYFGIAAVVVAIGGSLMFFGWFRKSKPQSVVNDVYSGLRNQVLSVKPGDIGVSPTSDMPVVWGVLMETAYPKAVVTLVSLADRTTSLYFSNGGGVIGAGEHAEVAQATIGLISLAQQFHSQMQPTASFPTPAVGKVRFYLLTFSGVLTAEADEQDLGHERHQLSPLFHKGHEVIGNVRLTSDQNSQ
jgi:hypothetical protein